MPHPNLLRDVNVDGYRLRTWETHTADPMGKAILAYEFTSPEGKVLFGGEDFACSPMDAIDSDESLRGLLFFLTLRPGDTDADYFADYTPEQMAFAQGDAENLSLYALEPEEGQNLPGFIDWEPR